MDRLRGLLGAGERARTGEPGGDRGSYKSPEVADLPMSTKAEAIVAGICRDVAEARGQRYTAVKLTGIASWEALKTASEALQIEVALTAAVVRPLGGVTYSGDSWQVAETRKTIASQLIRRSLPFSTMHVTRLVELWASQPYGLQWGLPGLAILGAAERHLQGAPAVGALRNALEALRDRALNRPLPIPKFETNVVARVAALLDPAQAAKPDLPSGPFALSLTDWLRGLEAGAGESWQALLVHAAGAGDKAKPAAKWLAQAAPLVAAVTPGAVTDKLLAWMDATTPDPAALDLSLDILKGLIWLSPGLEQARVAGPVGRFAERCFRKVSGIGARSVKLGNACLWALSEMIETPHAGAELFRLHTKLKLPSVRKLLAARLGELAAKSGIELGALEDASLPDFGLDREGRAHFLLGDAAAVVALNANGAKVRWFAAGGREVKAPPEVVKRDHADALKAVKLALKDVEAAHAAQVIRIEQGWQEARSWSVADWRRSFLDHPLRRQIANVLIWRFETAGASFAAMPADEALVTLTGEERALPDEGIVRLWHPLDGTPDEVLAWRRRIETLQITQPIKQAHREIYVLTDAELRTRTYSNRFAAHVLRQHQFRALCQARGWRFEFLGGWDNWNVPTRALPPHGLSVEYHVEPIEGGDHSDAYVPLHIATDQVRFIDSAGQAAELERVPPILFSECLRDVDLFVAVTSVANDPNWTDGGPDGRFGGYWSEWAFGDLSQTAETRRDLISALAPRLAIAGKLEVTDKFLVVQGRRQKYAIHFGSSNIQILPSNRYLCIVPDRGGARASEKVVLPFAGDSLLSIILSKAFLLVDERQIKDETILRQL